MHTRNERKWFLAVFNKDVKGVSLYSPASKYNSGNAAQVRVEEQRPRARMALSYVASAFVRLQKSERAAECVRHTRHVHPPFGAGRGGVPLSFPR